jgi:ADYC domain
MIAWALAACEPAPPAEKQPLRPGDEMDALDDRGEPLRFRIDAAERDPDDPHGDVTLYTLSVRSSPSGSWEPYCPPDASGRGRAIPLAGAWDTAGRYRDEPGLITFACTWGAIGKCVRFGYAPWRTVNGRSLRDAHLACVRMVRADYCGDGVGHTRDDTMLDFWDTLGVASRDLPPERPQVFEAAWTPDGAAYLSTPRWSDDPAEIVAQCPEKLRGRSALDERLEPDEVARRFPEALLFNARFVQPEHRMAPGAAPAPSQR